MKSRRPARPFPLAAVLVAFCAGVLVDWALRTYGPPQPVDAPTLIAPAQPEARLKPDTTQPPRSDPSNSADTASAVPTPPAVKSEPTATVGVSALRLPIDGMNLDLVKGGFYEARAGHRHEAVDILAPRNTPVRAVQSGTIAKLFFSRQGGITLYQFDPSGRLCYYYAHLQRYADNLHEGDAVAQGQVLGYVGTTGNAPPNTPHLHFAVFEVADDRRWWQGKAIDPYPLLKSSR
jgi:murein DD-endopeptidase MepM/ murein hydrolase activator NlpD